MNPLTSVFHQSRDVLAVPPPGSYDQNHRTIAHVNQTLHRSLRTSERFKYEKSLTFSPSPDRYNPNPKYCDKVTGSPKIEQSQDRFLIPNIELQKLSPDQYAPCEPRTIEHRVRTIAQTHRTAERFSFDRCQTEQLPVGIYDPIHSQIYKSPIHCSLTQSAERFEQNKQKIPAPCEYSPKPTNKGLSHSFGGEKFNRFGRSQPIILGLEKSSSTLLVKNTPPVGNYELRGMTHRIREMGCYGFSRQTSERFK